MLFRSIGGKLGNWNPVASSGGVQYPWKKKKIVKFNVTKYFLKIKSPGQKTSRNFFGDIFHFLKVKN